MHHMLNEIGSTIGIGIGIDLGIKMRIAENLTDIWITDRIGNSLLQENNKETLEAWCTTLPCSQDYYHLTLWITMMNPPNNSRQNPHKDCKYNAKELEQILPFKNIFINANTIPERLLILKSQMLLAMFNYWVGNGQEPRDQEESQSWTKVVVYAMIDKFGSNLIFFRDWQFGVQTTDIWTAGWHGNPTISVQSIPM